MDYSKKGSGASEGPECEPYPGAEIEREAYPHLVEFLTRCRYGDGSRREVGSLNVFVESGRLKVCVNDRDLDRVAFLTVDGLPECLVQVERALGKDTLDWRVPRERRGKKG